MPQRFIVGNWKMHKTIAEAETLVNGILKHYQPHPSVELAVAPSFVSLQAVARLIASTSIKLAAQNVSARDEGAFTGEVSPLMLREVGCQYIIVGHSERRHIFGETDSIINEKLRAALRHGISPILCVGEHLKEHQANQTRAVIQTQLQKGMEGLISDDLLRVVIAYEPVWAIGTGHAATVEQAAEVHAGIRTFLATQWNLDAEHIRIIYGGSVSSDNAKTFFHSSQINGALVGKACLDSESFVKIAKLAKTG